MSPEKVLINKTGKYYLHFMICDPELDGTIIRGRTVWQNRDGYLPGKISPLRTFFFFASLAYLSLGLVWILRSIQFRKNLVQLHHPITLVIAFTICEMSSKYFEYAYFESNGMRSISITLCATTFSSIEKTVSRVVILAFSMGYLVVKPLTLGAVTPKMLLLGVMYFFATIALEVVEHLGILDDFSRTRATVPAFLVTILDVRYIMWIFSSLISTLEEPEVKRDMAKLRLYGSFIDAFAIYVLCSMGLTCVAVNKLANSTYGLC